MILAVRNAVNQFVGLIDYALRRRTSFYYTNFDCVLISNSLRGLGSAPEKLVCVLEEINGTLADSNCQRRVVFFLQEHLDRELANI